MSIVKAKKPMAAAENKATEAFIEGAPDGAGKQDRKGTGRGAKVGKKEQIPVIMAPDLLERLDAVAARLSMSRSATITLAVNQFLKSEIAE